MNTLLIGARASGKTTVARLLAPRLGLKLVDLDERALSTFCEHSIREVWSHHGEQAWRQAEVECLRSILRFDQQVIAMGGGTPAIPEAAAMLRDAREHRAATIIYLKCEAAELISRLKSEPGDRPPLAGSPAEEVERVLAVREPIYRALATLVVDTTARQPTQIADYLAETLSAAPDV